MTNNRWLNPEKTETLEWSVELVLTLCPLCGAAETSDLLLLRDWGYGGPGVFPLVRCRHCGLRYLQQRPTPAQMDRYYPSHYVGFRPAIEDERFALMRWMRRRRIARHRHVVEQFSAVRPGSILDIGCSTGIFLAEMKAAGWQTVGVEPNVAAAAYARQRFGLEVQTGYLSEIILPLAGFDAVTMWDVLEHTFEPLDTLRQIHALLQPNGIVAMIVPNDHSLDRYLFGPTWVGYDTPRHLTVFAPETLRRMLAEAGFEVVTIRCGFGGYYSFTTSLKIWLNRSVSAGWLRRAILALAYLPGMRLPFEPYFRLLDRLGWGNELLVVGRKVK
ncbi:MAG: class I SAM-dependent methyltransferase [Chloroflexi bacterium]|nr:class I SAM-dependent methyltransferase [Chloroflexota bacterium]